RSLNGRREADQNRGGKRDSQGEEQNPAIDANLGGIREIAGEGEQELNATIGQRDTENAADQSENSAFGEELRDQPGAARAQRHAKGIFLAARFGAELQQVGDVDAGDQQDEADGAEEWIEKLSGAAKQILMEREGFYADAFVARGILLLKARCDQVHFGLGLLDRDAFFQARDWHQPVVDSGGVAAAGGIDGNPEIDAAAEERREVRLHDADDRREHALDGQSLAQHVGVTVELPLPEFLTDDHRLGMVLGFGGFENAAED